MWSTWSRQQLRRLRKRRSASLEARRTFFLPFSQQTPNVSVQRDRTSSTLLSPGWITTGWQRRTRSPAANCKCSTVVRVSIRAFFFSPHDDEDSPGVSRYAIVHLACTSRSQPCSTVLSLSTWHTDVNTGVAAHLSTRAFTHAAKSELSALLRLWIPYVKRDCVS